MATIRIVDNISGFTEMKPLWDMLYNGNKHLTIFQSFDWNMNAWIHDHAVRFNEDKLFIIHAVQEGKVQREAIIPLCISKGGILHFIGQMMSDVLDAITPEHRDCWNGFYADIIHFIRKQKDVKDVSFYKLDAESEVLTYFGVYWPCARIERQESYSYFDAPQGHGKIADVFPHLTSSERSEIKRTLSKVPEYSFSILSQENGNPYPKERLLRLRNWMVESGLRSKYACPDVFIDCMNAVYDAGLCELSCMEDSEGDFVYAAYRLLSRSHVTFWLVLYKDKIMTTVGDIKYILQKSCEGAYRFDFGIGTYTYKLRTYRPFARHVYSLKGHPLTLKNFVRDEIKLLKQYVKVALQYLRKAYHQ